MASSSGYIYRTTSVEQIRIWWNREVTDFLGLIRCFQVLKMGIPFSRLRLISARQMENVLTDSSVAGHAKEMGKKRTDWMLLKLFSVIDMAT